ncbi:MAG TPA: hypothetical protein VMT73_11555 [Anaerolineales bacterium]|nr:hypothetical protein [Anaerolineales bacterium]
MRVKIVASIAFVFFLLACGVLATPAPQVDTVSTMVAATEQALTASAPTVAPTPSGITSSFQNVSIVIPNGLASGAQAQQVAAVGDQGGAPWEVGPAHVTMTLTDYVAARDGFLQPTIYVYPASEYAAANPGAANSLPRLKTIIANPSTPLTHDTLPIVPFFNADQIIATQTGMVNFKTGSGVRVVAEYAQGVGPISNEGLMYHYEGLTTDGKYYVIVLLPINAPFLSSSSDPSVQPPAGGIPFPDLNSTDPSVFEKYYQDVTDKLNATSPNAFQPNLNTLDALVQSIFVTP